MLVPRGKMQPLPGSSVACDLADSTPAPCSPANYLQLTRLHHSQCNSIHPESPELYPVWVQTACPILKLLRIRPLSTFELWAGSESRFSSLEDRYPIPSQNRQSLRGAATP